MYNSKIFVLQFLFFFSWLAAMCMWWIHIEAGERGDRGLSFFKLRFNKTTYSTARVIKYPTWFFSTGTVRNHLILF